MPAPIYFLVFVAVWAGVKAAQSRPRESRDSIMQFWGWVGFALAVSYFVWGVK